MTPSMKWIETISYNVGRQRLSVIFSNFVQAVGSIDASIADADVTSVPSGTP